MKSEENIITIDGPSASGKGSLTRALSKELNYKILDSGLLYRAYAFFKNKDFNDIDIKNEIRKLEIKVVNKSIIVKFRNVDITHELRSELTAKLASKLSKLKSTRENLLDIQRDQNDGLGLIADGRDMGTVVFPNASKKFFLTANPEERAKRRYHELIKVDKSINLSDLIKQIHERDLQDISRKISPLKPANDANIIDTSEMNEIEVFKHVMCIINM